jgi:hypothetical protein
MSQELHYTSVARGLKPGSRGFGTVAATANLPQTVAERLEALSAYEAVYPPGDPSAALNPIEYVHVRLTAVGHVQEILSRIGPAGLDYSGRPNKYAHHVILEPEERPEGGPAWLLSQPGFLRDAWQGEPRILADGPCVPAGDRVPGIAQAWLDLTGDAGWAGVLAESFLNDPRRPVFLVFQPGMELLPLFVEAIALLPVPRRWDVEFSTYFTSLPPGISCTWRGVLDGSPQAKIARRLPNALIVDLCRPLDRAQGGGLVHLARTGERLDTPDAGTSPARHGARRPPTILAGPPPRPRNSTAGRAPGTSTDGDWLPDLAARLAEDESLLGGDRLRRPRRPSAVITTILIAACLLLMAAAALYLSPSLRRQVGLETSRTVPVASHPAAAEPGRPDPPARAGGVEKPKDAEAPVPAVGKAAGEKGSERSGETVAGANPVAKADAPAPGATKPAVPLIRPPLEPLILAFAPPGVIRSAFGSPAKQERAIRFPEDTEDRIEILNGPGFRLTPASATPHAWEIATRTGSTFAGGFVLARLNRTDAATWRFEWSESARAQATQVEGLKDAILGLRSRGGRPIYVPLRGVELHSDQPLVVWNDQRILFDKMDVRTRSVDWAGNSEVLDGSHWKPRIRRWKVILTRTESGAGGDQPSRRVVEPAAAADGKDSNAKLPLERDLVSGEVTLKVAIDPTNPGSIEMRVAPDPKRVAEGREARSTRIDELKKNTPKDKDGNTRDPLEYRRARLSRLRADGDKDQEAMKTLEREIGDLERIKDIREMEDLLTRPARVELSVVIGLDVEGPGILDIVRIGAFAGRR